MNYILICETGEFMAMDPLEEPQIRRTEFVEGWGTVETPVAFPFPFQTVTEN